MPKKKPHFIDQYIGRCIRRRRKRLGMSQEKLARAIGVTFQQIQKYETGANRISASKLYEISKALKTHPSVLFDGVEKLKPDFPKPEDCISISRADLDFLLLFKDLNPIAKCVLLLLTKKLAEAEKLGGLSCH